MSDRIKSVMGLLRRYESLFSLPTRIMQETERGEFETVFCSRILLFATACMWRKHVMQDVVWLQCAQ